MAAATRKVLVPLATALAAGAIAVGSGATFASQSGNTLSTVTSGTLTQLNSKADSAIFQLADIKPGDTLHGYLSVTNTGSLPAQFSLTESSSTNQFTGDNLSLRITNTTTGTQVYSGSFGGLVDGVKNDLGVVEPGANSEYRFTVQLAADAPNTEQGKSAGATYQWDSVQADGATTEQP
jgi:spore coat-associated protein N